MIHYFLLLFLKAQLKKITLHGSLGQFLQMSTRQSTCILTNTRFPSQCDYCLERSHYTLDYMLSDKTPFSNQDNNSKNIIIVR